MNKKILRLVPILILLASAYYFLITPVKSTGSDNTLFKSNQFYLADKITYLFRPPQVGDSILFKTSFEPNSEKKIGLIYFKHEGFSRSTDLTTAYLVINSKNTDNDKQVYLITSDRILGHVYFPNSLLTKDELKAVSKNQPTQEEIKQMRESIAKEAITSYSGFDGGVFLDENNNLTRDPDEKGVYFRRISVVDDNGTEYFQPQYAGLEIRSTDPNGNFRFTDLPYNPPRHYTILIEDETGKYQTEFSKGSITLTNVTPQTHNYQIPVTLIK